MDVRRHPQTDTWTKRPDRLTNGQLRGRYGKSGRRPAEPAWNGKRPQDMDPRPPGQGHKEETAGPRLTLSPSKSKCTRKMAASLMGTSSFLYRIWKTRLCTVPSWTQAECRLLPSAKQEPAGARELRLPRPAAPSGVCRGLKAAAPSRTLVPRDQNRRTRCPRVEIPAHWIGLASQKEPRSTPDEPCDLGRIPCRTAGRAPRLEISTC